MTDQAQIVRDLAEAGGICETCGGLHVPDIDTALLSARTDFEWCDCEGCAPCAAFRETLLKLRDEPEDLE
jgi:hypothetical protein